jgi:hypothetical protein
VLLPAEFAKGVLRISVEGEAFGDICNDSTFQHRGPNVVIGFVAHPDVVVDSSACCDNDCIMKYCGSRCLCV